MGRRRGIETVAARTRRDRSRRRPGTKVARIVVFAHLERARAGAAERAAIEPDATPRRNGVSPRTPYGAAAIWFWFWFWVGVAARAGRRRASCASFSRSPPRSPGRWERPAWPGRPGGAPRRTSNPRAKAATAWPGSVACSAGSGPGAYPTPGANLVLQPLGRFGAAPRRNSSMRASATSSARTRIAGG